MTDKQLDKQLTKLVRAMYRAEESEYNNFQNKELKQKYGKEYLDIFYKIEALLKENDKPIDYWRNLPVVKKHGKKSLEINKKIWKLTVLEEEAKCEGPKPAESFYIYDPFEINGDVIITDPCYIDKWIGCEHKRDTIYGDWSCSVWECDPDTLQVNSEEKPFGHFAADGAMVCVTPIDKSDNKDKIEKFAKERPDLACLIKNFNGKVNYEVRTRWYAYKGKWEKEDFLTITGIGTVKNKPFAFTTYQTGF